jgi:hypothetical protein
MRVWGLSFSLSGRDDDSNRLQLTGQNPYHTPIWVCTSLAWVTIHPIRRWVWIEPQGPGDGWCQVAQVKPAHGQPRPSTSFLASPRCVPQSKSHLERGTWLHGQNELSIHYVQGTFNLNQGLDNEAVLKWHKQDQRIHVYLAPTIITVTPDPVRSSIIHYHMVLFHDSKYSQPW